MAARAAERRASLGRARFPDVAPDAPHYESWFVTACHPRGGIAVWIRYTVQKRPRRAATGALWCTLFDARAGVVAAKAQVAEPTLGEGSYVVLGDARIGPRGAVGRADSDHVRASWQLEFSAGEDTFCHLPATWMYDARLPRTKLLAEEPVVGVDGTVAVDDRTIELAGWRGTVGHNWGREHAERAIWIHGAGFPGHEDAWLDLALGRIRLGPLVTPWIAGGALSLAGRRHRLGGPARIRSTRIVETPQRCAFELRGGEIAVAGSVGAPRERFVGWLYAQPEGGERQTVNCSIADLRLTVARRGEPSLELALDGAAAYELQMRERDASIQIQPFPDG